MTLVASTKTPNGRIELSDTTTWRHLPLHAEAFRILLALRRGERHGYALVKELERDPDRSGRILPANLYRKIRTLLRDGLISEARRRVDPDTDDQRRRYFRITELGEAVAKAEISRLHGLLAEAGGPLTQ
jgi:DNA-binding PadR family transcriptional regulator